jgi:hypothetical protein
LALNALALFDFKIASAQEDLKDATDMVITTSGEKKIAVRIRRGNVWQRDLTIRAWRASGVKTEWPKIKEGAGDYYLYGWEGPEKLSLVDWVLVDLHQLRASGLMECQWNLIRNPDGLTGFYAIPVTALWENNCVINATIARGGCCE